MSGRLQTLSIFECLVHSVRHDGQPASFGNRRWTYVRQAQLMGLYALLHKVSSGNEGAKDGAKKNGEPVGGGSSAGKFAFWMTSTSRLVC